jgi:hypothetical protein
MEKVKLTREEMTTYLVKNVREAIARLELQREEVKKSRPDQDLPSRQKMP